MRITLLISLLILQLMGCGEHDNTDGGEAAQEQQTPTNMEVLLTGQDVIWGFDFLPDGRMIISERSQGLSLFNPQNKDLTSIEGEPNFLVRGEGGMLDVRLHPDFATNGFVYFCFNEAMGGNTSSTVLSRAQLTANQLNTSERLFTATAVDSSIHFGCRIEFDGEGHLFFSTGERNQRLAAQVPESPLGKIIRMNDDGSEASVWSIGHRNVQGLAIRPEDGELWASELGPTGGDELNHIQERLNYGWPQISHGQDELVEAASREGFEDPLAFWVPSISPSALAFYQGDAYLACLSGQHIRRLVLQGEVVTLEEPLFEELGWRFRNVRSGPDGLLYFSTDEGRLGKLKQGP